MKCFSAFGLIVLIATACNNSSGIDKSTQAYISQKNESIKEDTIIVVDSITSIDTAASILPGETIIEATIPANALPVAQLQKTISSEGQSIHVIITDLDVGSLRVGISHSKPDANIRISQIIKPDGSSDGPFGQTLVYDIKQAGNYTLVIHKSNMASGSQVGDVWISIER